MENMKQNMISDEDLDQISGGRGIFEAFTTEFRSKAEKVTTLKMNPEDENNNFGITTLEMRANPLDIKDATNNRKVVKL